jgi:hypothetical protein
MDTLNGGYLLNATASYYNIPYFDIGVRLDAIVWPLDALIDAQDLSLLWPTAHRLRTEVPGFEC